MLLLRVMLAALAVGPFVMVVVMVFTVLGLTALVFFGSRIPTVLAPSAPGAVGAPVATLSIHYVGASFALPIRVDVLACNRCLGGCG